MPLGHINLDVIEFDLLELITSRLGLCRIRRNDRKRDYCKASDNFFLTISRER